MALNKRHNRLYLAINNLKRSNYAILHRVGQRATSHLWSNYLSGQMINYKGQFDKRGTRKYNYTIGKRRKSIIIRSYPLNIWERGYTTKLRKKVAGKYIFRKFGRDVRGSVLARWVNDALQSIASRELAR